MQLKHLQLIEESDDAWRLRDRRDGSSFHVAKKGLGKKTHDSIVQHFAHGGMVKPVKMAMGGSVPSVVQDKVLAASGFPVRGDDPFLNPAPPQTRFVDPGAAPVAPPPVDPAMALAQAEKAKVDADAALASAMQAWKHPPGWKPDGDPAIAALRQKAAEAGSARSAMAPAPAPAEDIQMTPGQAPTGQPQPVSQPRMQMPSGVAPGVDRELTDASKQAQEAERQKAIAAQQAAQAQARLAADYQARREQMAAEWDARLAQSQSRADQLSQDIATSKIDPSSFWHSRDTGQKVLASIGLILGGISAGITGGPNYAQQVIDKAIEKDVDAQEKNLGRKQNLLSHYIQQGHTIQEAKRFASADAKDMYAAQLEQAAAKHAGAQAMPAALETSAKLRRQTAIDRQNAFSDSLSNRVKLAELEHKMASKTAANMVAPGYLQGSIPIQDKEKADFRERVSVQGDVRGAIQTLKGIAKRAGTESLPTDAAGQIEALESDLLISVAKAAKMGSLDKGLQEVIGKQIGSLRTMKPLQWTNAISKLEQLQRNIDRKVNSEARSLGLQPMQQGTPGGLVSVPRSP